MTPTLHKLLFRQRTQKTRATESKRSRAKLSVTGHLCVLLMALQTTLHVAGVQANPNRLPSLGDASSSLISPELEKRIGESFLKQLNATLPTVNDPLMKYYVTKQIHQLAEHSDLREAILNVVIIDNPDINAFAAPSEKCLPITSSRV